MDQVSNISMRLKQALENSNMTNTELSENTHISLSLLSKYLSGVCEPKKNNLHAIANVLQVNPFWLLGYDVPMRDEIFSLKEEAIRNILEKLNDYQIEKVLAFIEDYILDPKLTSKQESK